VLANFLIQSLILSSNRSFFPVLESNVLCVVKLPVLCSIVPALALLAFVSNAKCACEYPANCDSGRDQGEEMVALRAGWSCLVLVVVAPLPSGRARAEVVTLL